MGIGRDSRHKKRKTGGMMPIHQKKRAFEKARPPSMTKLQTAHSGPKGTVYPKRIRKLRVRGGNFKFRALRLSTGNFSWASEGISKKCNIMDIVYNSSNNELVRTKTLVKNCIVYINANPLVRYFKHFYGYEILKKKEEVDEKEVIRKMDVIAKELTEDKNKKHQKVKKSFDSVAYYDNLIKSYKNRKDVRKSIEKPVMDQLSNGKILACISSRPGQCGRADGYILEGAELEFYKRKLERKKK